MRISELHINNFRSFGNNTQKVNVDDLTALIGGNSAGKTSLIIALLRLFGQKNFDRTLIKTDFHVPEYTSTLGNSEKSLLIEAKIEFPELEIKNSQEIITIPEFIKHLVIEQSGNQPYLRMRLVGKWIQGTSPEGNIEQELYYVKVPFGQTENDDDLVKVPIHHRNLIQMMYVPAMRNPTSQLKNASGTLLWRIFDGIEWPESLDRDIKNLTTPIETLFKDVEGIKRIQEILNTQWNKYHKDSRFSKSNLKFNSNTLDDFLKNVEILFNPSVDGNSVKVDELGDGLKSLFYITLVSSLLEIENNQDKTDKPLLNILAIEEPENHISQHLLGRVVRNLKEIASKENAQVILSSHNSSIIGKIDPENIRHLQIQDSESIVNGITLPQKTDEAHTYIKEAIKAYPDLYFSKLVVLGEGDSEEIILPKLLSTSNILLDDFNISIVPLGGRHVNHMWKLLNSLSIPHVTLLDLDRERGGGGWGRIKYVLKQLDANDRIEPELLTVRRKRKKDVYTYTMNEVETFHDRNVEDVNSMNVWINKLEKEDVFFSYPLDIDFSMLLNFESEYHSTMSQGPRGIDDENLDQYKDKLNDSIQATLKSSKATGKTYTLEERKAMIWYNSLFLGRGKPSTHIEALKEVNSETLISKSPAELLRLVERIKSKVGFSDEG